MTNRTNRFGALLLGGVGVLCIGASLLEQDRRGILFAQDPEVFSIAEMSFDQNAGGSYPIIWGDNGYRTRPAPAATRRIDRRPSGGGRTPAFADSDIGNQAGGGIAAVTPPASSVLPQSGAAQPPSALSTGASGAPQTAALQNIPVIGQGSGPIGGFLNPVATDPETPPPAPTDPVDPLDPTDPVTPVVPAVPEPASWLLMILGIGALGAALRMQNRKSVIPIQV